VSKGLTPQQDKFAQGVAEGKSQAEAYRAAYPKSEKWQPASIHKRAMRLHALVLPRIEEIRAELVAKGLWTREESVKALRDVVANPEKKSDVVAAVKELNAMHGFHAPIKHDLTINPAQELAALQEARRKARGEPG